MDPPIEDEPMRAYVEALAPALTTGAATLGFVSPGVRPGMHPDPCTLSPVRPGCALGQGRLIISGRNKPLEPARCSVCRPQLPAVQTGQSRPA